MTERAPIAYLWIDLEVPPGSQRPIASIASAFEEMGAVGIVTWEPGASVRVALAQRNGKLLGVDSIDQLALAVAARLGTTVYWEPEGEESGVVEATLASARTGERQVAQRSVVVLSAPAIELGDAPFVRKGLPGSPPPGSAKLVSLGQRTAFVSNWLPARPWSRRLRPSVGISLYPTAIWLDIWLPRVATSQRPPADWSDPSVSRYWCAAEVFGGDATMATELQRMKFLHSRNGPSRLENLSDAATSLGLASDAADRLNAIMDASYSDNLLPQLIDILELPQEIEKLLAGEDLPSAPSIPVLQIGSWQWRTQRHGHSLTT